MIQTFVLCAMSAITTKMRGAAVTVCIH